MQPLKHHLSDHAPVYLVVVLVLGLFAGVIGACHGFDKSVLSEIF